MKEPPCKERIQRHKPDAFLKVQKIELPVLAKKQTNKPTTKI
jgi:hypothetical protein